MKMNLPQNEIELIASYLRELERRMENDGCTDIPNKRKKYINKTMLQEAAFEEDCEWKTILSNEQMLVGHLATKLHCLIGEQRFLAATAKPVEECSRKATP